MQFINVNRQIMRLHSCEKLGREAKQKMEASQHVIITSKEPVSTVFPPFSHSSHEKMIMTMERQLSEPLQTMAINFLAEIGRSELSLPKKWDINIFGNNLKHAAS